MLKLSGIFSFLAFKKDLSIFRAEKSIIFQPHARSLGPINTQRGRTTIEGDIKCPVFLSPLPICLSYVVSWVKTNTSIRL